jgi:hypothetical protein
MSGNEKFGGVLANFKIFIVQILFFVKLTRFLAHKNKKLNNFSNFEFVRA